MKKKMIMLLALLCAMTAGFAEDKVEVGSVTAPQGGNGSFDIVLKNSTEFVAFTMRLTLPDGIVYDGYTQGSRIKGETVSDNTEGNVVNFARLSLSNDVITGNDGTLLTVNFHTTESAKTGDALEATLTELTFTTADEQESTLADVNISITIGEPADTRTVLDELSTTAPTAATDVDVRVKRTITAGVWNTLCLPFAMTAEQVKQAFGSDVQLGDFKGCKSEFDGDDDNVIALKVKFESATAIEANHPYIIKVSADVEEFTVDGVDIDADEALIEYDNGKTGSRRVVYSGFYGTYEAGTVLDAETLFLNDNKFWYSTGATRMKAYRAYFAFLDVLSSYTPGANARIRIAFNDATGVGGVKQAAELTDGHVYNLQGQRVENPRRGAYIKNGKVIIVK